MTEKRLVQTLVGVYGFYDKELTEFSIRIWLDACAEFDVGLVEQAFNRHLRDPEAGKWLPKPADIIRQLRGDENDAALIAWGKVMQRAAAGGGFNGEAVPDAARQAVDSLGGWSTICRANTEHNGFLQKRFIEAFKAYKRREEAPPLAPALVYDAVKRIGA